MGTSVGVVLDASAILPAVRLPFEDRFVLFKIPGKSDGLQYAVIVQGDHHVIVQEIGDEGETFDIGPGECPIILLTLVSFPKATQGFPTARRIDRRRTLAIRPFVPLETEAYEV